MTELLSKHNALCVSQSFMDSELLFSAVSCSKPMLVTGLWSTDMQMGCV